jgi:His/Glu/Gln/Arg/opine family amino acid ABC transporter permease subunit
VIRLTTKMWFNPAPVGAAGGCDLLLSRSPAYQQFPPKPLCNRASAIASVPELLRKDDKAEVTLRNDAGDEQHLTVDENSLQVAQGDDVAEGDVIGVTRHWAAGPLMWGLWTTLWLSVVSGVLGLLIGLATGLCRLSNNPTLRDLSTIYVELVRGTPLLVQIFIFYFFIGTVMNLSRESPGSPRCRCSPAPTWRRSSVPVCSRLPVARTKPRAPWV